MVLAMRFINLFQEMLVLGFIFLTITYSNSFHKLNASVISVVGHPSASYSYARFSEVEKACKPFLSSSSNLELDTQRACRLKIEMSFQGGNWKQVPGNWPLMPCDNHDDSGSYSQKNSSGLSAPLRLATFHLMHLDPTHRFGNAVNVSAVLKLSMSRNNATPYSLSYTNSPGSFELVFLFQGIYIESKKNGGERVLCLLGNSTFTSKCQDSGTNKLQQVRNRSSRDSHLTFLQDDQILLILRFPKVLTLVKRGVWGVLKSLNDKSSPMYFDEVHLSSHLNDVYNMYQFAAKELVSNACVHCPYQDDIVNGNLEVYKGDRFGPHLNWLLHKEVLKIMPNWNCNSTAEYCDKLGPFELKASSGGGFANVGMVIQDLRWVQITGSNNVRVSAVFRVIPLVEKQQLSTSVNGLDGTTISAEGTWSSTTGHLCMLGCLGLAEYGCQSHICLYVSNSFSITQRSIVVGTISSINALHFPLSFELPSHPLRLFGKLSHFRRPTYRYSKINLAEDFLQRSERVDLCNIIKKSLLRYPQIGDNGDELVSLSILADDLTMVAINQAEKPIVVIEILSLESASSSKNQLLKVSAELTLSDKPYINVSMLYLEGMYNQVNGKMHLIGCRDVRASWKRLSDLMDNLEGGFDCFVEVKVEYPPRNALWWAMNPSAKISITSQRNATDPLYFIPIKLHTRPILYREHQEDIRFRREMEGILCILTLSVTIVCMIKQLLHIRGNKITLPCTSLVMLGVQAIGYTIQLITGLAMSMSRSNYGFENNDALLQITNSIGMILLLAICLVTLKLCQRVWKSRAPASSGAPRASNETIVLAISLAVHFCGYLIAFSMHQIEVGKNLEMLASMPSELTSIDAYTNARDSRYELHEWVVQLERYIGLVHDFYLLPQIIQNYLWRIDCKPLSKVYYLGITAVRLLPHVYDYIYIRVPGFEPFNPYFSKEFLLFVNTSLNFYSKFGDVMITLAVVAFALIVYIQQARSSQQKL